MKKFVSILIIICLVFGAAITYTGCGANNAAEPETSPEPSLSLTLKRCTQAMTPTRSL